MKALDDQRGADRYATGLDCPRPPACPLDVEQLEEIALDSFPDLPLALAGRFRIAEHRAEGREDQALELEEVQRRLRQDLFLQGRVKRELLMRASPERAAATIARALGATRPPRILRGRVRTMRDHLRERGLSYAEISVSSSFPIACPRVLGCVQGPAIQAIGRTPFVGSVANAMVRHRSSLVRIGHDFLLDAQSDELDDIPIHLEADPAVLGRHGDEIIAFEPDEQTSLEVQEAVHLGGVPSRAFGHWLGQFLLKYFAARAAGLLRPVPILIDADMPATHREALSFFLGEDVEIVELPVMASARVSRLWLLGDWVYVPLCPVAGSDLGPRRLSLSPHAGADIVRSMLDRRGLRSLAVPATDRLFLARRPEQHRKLANHRRIEEIARRRNFRIVHLEDFPFAEQVALIRTAREIVGPDGSSLIMCMFAQPGTKITILSHAFMENNASLVALLSALDLDVLMVQGRCVREDAVYRRLSDYEIEEADFEMALSR